MHLHTIEARDISEAWYRVIREVLKNGTIRPTPTGAYKGSRKKELDFVFLEIKEPWTLPLLPEPPSGLPVPCDMKEVEDWVVSLMSCVERGNIPNFYGCYFESQIEYVIRFYKDKANWDSDMMCMLAGSEDNITLPDPWVLKVIDTKIEEGTLDVIAYFRALEVWAGLPLFGAVLQQLKEYIVTSIGAKDGKIYMVGKGFCLYEFAWDWAQILCPSVE